MLLAAALSAAVMTIAASPAVVAFGPLSVLTLVAACISAMAALLGTLDTLQLHSPTSFTFASQHNLSLAFAVCVGALLGPIAPAATHICFRLSRDHATECSAVGVCAAALPLAASIISAAALLPPFSRSDDAIRWLPLLLSASAAVRLAFALRRSRRVHPQDVVHDKGAFALTQMNASVRSVVRIKDIRAALQSEKVLKKWAFGYLFVTLEHWKVAAASGVAPVSLTPSPRTIPCCSAARNAASWRSRSF